MNNAEQTADEIQTKSWFERAAYRVGGTVCLSAVVPTIEWWPDWHQASTWPPGWIMVAGELAIAYASFKEASNPTPSMTLEASQPQD